MPKSTQPPAQRDTTRFAGSRQQRNLTRTLAALFALPLFFTLDGDILAIELTKAMPSPPDDSILPPISIGLVAAPLLYTLQSRERNLPNGYGTARKAIHVTIAVFTIALLAGLVQGGGWLTAAFYLQTALPLILLLALFRRQYSMVDVAFGMVLASALSLTVILGWAILFDRSYPGDLETARHLATAIHGFKAYYPFVLAATTVLAITHRRQLPRLSIYFALCLLLVLPVIYTRTGLVMILLAVALPWFMGASRMDARSRTVIFFVLIISAVAFAADLGARGVIGQRSDATESNARRIDLLSAGLSRVAGNPFLGDSFLPYAGELNIVDRRQGVRLFPAHNQYVDFALRGGLVALGGLLMLLALLLWAPHLSSALRTSPTELARRAVVCIFAVGMVAHLYFVEPAAFLPFCFIAACSSWRYASGDSASPGTAVRNPRTSHHGSVTTRPAPRPATAPCAPQTHPPTNTPNIESAPPATRSRRV